MQLRFSKNLHAVVLFVCLFVHVSISGSFLVKKMYTNVTKEMLEFLISASA